MRITIAGQPAPEEIAAVTIVLTALTVPAAGGGTGLGQGRQRSAWSQRSRLLGPALSPGPGAWRASALPR
ncbi:MAG: acyl-CoA carboxylase subunit epsilon [Streptosporangiaceae bacterium]